MRTNILGYPNEQNSETNRIINQNFASNGEVKKMALIYQNLEYFGLHALFHVPLYLLHVAKNSNEENILNVFDLFKINSAYALCIFITILSAFIRYKLQNCEILLSLKRCMQNQKQKKTEEVEDNVNAYDEKIEISPLGGGHPRLNSFQASSHPRRHKLTEFQQNVQPSLNTADAQPILSLWQQTKSAKISNTAQSSYNYNFSDIQSLQSQMDKKSGEFGNVFEQINQTQNPYLLKIPQEILIEEIKENDNRDQFNSANFIINNEKELAKPKLGRVRSEEQSNSFNFLSTQKSKFQNLNTKSKFSNSPSGRNVKQLMQSIEERTSNSQSHDEYSNKSDTDCSQTQTTHPDYAPNIIETLFPRRRSSQKDLECKLSLKQKEQIELVLNAFGICYLALMQMLFVYLRYDFLNGNYMQQFSQYMLIYYLANSLLCTKTYKQTYYVICYCSLQYPNNDTQASFQLKFCHIVINLFFLFEIVFQQQSETIKQDGLNRKINKIIESDNQLKNLVHLVPYGLAVLNLEDVSHFNQPFAKVLEITKQRQILKGLEKFQRKIAKVDENKQNQGIDFLKTQMGQVNLSKKSNLIQDLKFLLQNKDQAFNESNNIFEIYFVEKNDQQTTSSFAQYKFNKQPSYSSQNSRDTNQIARKFYSISISPIKWSRKDCLLITVKDITSEKLVDQKQVLDRLKNLIFQSFSHELKTPLNGIMVSIETSNFISENLIKNLEKEKSRNIMQSMECLNQSKQICTQLKIMESCSFLLKNIMHDFFDYNMLQSNELTLNIKEFDLNECIKDIQRITSYQLQSDNIKFYCKVEYQNTTGFIQTNQNPKIKMISDKDRLQQVLLNLLMNGIKFTNKGSLSLEVFVSADQTVKFKVKDTGFGIEEQRLPFIFNLFENNSGNFQQYFKSNLKSARMGLPISQNICQMMGGQINVKSKLGKGSNFYFRLPLVLDQNNMQPIRRNSSETSILTGRTITQNAPSTDSFLLSEDPFNKRPELTLEKNSSSSQRRQSGYDQLPSFKKKNQELYLNKRTTQIGSFELVFKPPLHCTGGGVVNERNIAFFNFNKDNFQQEQPALSMHHSSTVTEASKSLEAERKSYPSNSQFKKLKAFSVTVSPLGDQDIALPKFKLSQDDSQKEKEQIHSEHSQDLENLQLVQPQFSFMKHPLKFERNQSIFNNEQNSSEQKLDQIIIEESKSEAESSERQEGKFYNTPAKDNPLLFNKKMTSEQLQEQYNQSRLQNGGQYFSIIQMLNEMNYNNNNSEHHQIELSDSSDVSQTYLETTSPQNCNAYDMNERTFNVNQFFKAPESVTNLIDQVEENKNSERQPRSQVNDKSSKLDIAIDDFQDTCSPMSISSKRDMQQESPLNLKKPEVEKEYSFKLHDRQYSFMKEITFQKQDSKEYLLKQKQFQNYLNLPSNDVANSPQEFQNEIDNFLLENQVSADFHHSQEEEKKELATSNHSQVGNNPPFNFSYWPQSDPLQQLPCQNIQQLDITPKYESHFKSVTQNKGESSGQQSNQLQQYSIFTSPMQRPEISQPSNFIAEVAPDQERCCPEVMIVDDIQMNRFVVDQMLLLIFEIKVIEAQNGQECIDKLRDFYSKKSCNCQGIQIILMDIEMPVMNGLQATRGLISLMNSYKIPHIPIVALTAFLDEKQNCEAAGMKGFMNKPTSKSDLSEILEQFNVQKNFKA